jgi:hypothetical protein
MVQIDQVIDAASCAIEAFALVRIINNILRKPLADDKEP